MYRTIRKYTIYTLALTLFVGCFSHDDILVGESDNTSATKIINSANSAEAGSLLIKFNANATRAFELAEENADVTRSNIEPLNMALKSIGATSIERLFPIDERHEDRARAAGLHHWYIVYFDSSSELESAAMTIAEIEDVDIVQYNSTISYQPSEVIEVDVESGTRLSVAEVNDPGFKNQWHYYNTGSGIHEEQVAGMDVNVKDAWRYCTGDSSIIVAVLDEGVDYTHEDLKDNMWVNSREIPGNGLDDDKNGYADDIHGVNHYTGGDITWNKLGDKGHGTHVAGTIAAVNNNGIGVCGVAGGDGSGNGVRIISSQLFNGRDTKGSSAVSARAFQYAANNGAVIAQCSWGYDAGALANDSQFKSYASAEYDGIRYFQSAKNSDVIDGGLVIFAAGNDSKNMASYPGAYREFIAVASTGCDGMPAPYTNYNAGVNISAPGGNTAKHGSNGGVLSTIPKNIAKSGYGYMQGTSMACPHVSGVAALGLSYAKKLGKKFTLEEFTAMLLLSVDDIDADLKANPTFSSLYSGNMGSGRINALRMLMNVEGTPCINVPRRQDFRIDLRPFLADDVKKYSIRNIYMSDEDKVRLGVSNGPFPFSNKELIITCDNVGHGFIEVEFVVGGPEAGSDNSMGGRVTKKRIALIVRDSHATNGGWM